MTPLWSVTAAEHAAFAPLEADTSADVAIVGGGILGLSAARAIAEAGRSVVVLEATQIGAGASGRNGGLVVPSLPRVGPDDVLRAMGPERGARFIEIVLGAPTEVFALIRRFGIACGAEQAGWLNPAHGPTMVAALERRFAAWHRHGGQAVLISRAETQARTGSPLFHGALADPTGGHLNPLAYVRGLARAAAATGAAVHEASPVRRIERQAHGWTLTTDRGSIRAGQILQATNAQPPALSASAAAQRSTVPLTVYQLATPVLAPEIRAQILPGGESMSDTRNNLFAACVDDTGRIVTGGMAPLTQIGAPGWLPTLLARRLARIFPQLGPVTFDHVWRGRASLTPDFLPRLFEMAPGWIVPFTCNGRGVALSTAMGARIGTWLATGDLSGLPLRPTPPAPIRLHAVASRLPQLLLPLGMLADSRNERTP